MVQRETITNPDIPDKAPITTNIIMKDFTLSTTVSTSPSPVGVPRPSSVLPKLTMNIGMVLATRVKKFRGPRAWIDRGKGGAFFLSAVDFRKVRDKTRQKAPTRIKRRAVGRRWRWEGTIRSVALTVHVGCGFDGMKPDANTSAREVCSHPYSTVALEEFQGYIYSPGLNGGSKSPHDHKDDIPPISIRKQLAQRYLLGACSIRSGTNVGAKFWTSWALNIAAAKYGQWKTICSRVNWATLIKCLLASVHPWWQQEDRCIQSAPAASPPASLGTPISWWKGRGQQ